MRTLAPLLLVSVLMIGCTSSGIDGTWMLVSRTLPDGSVQEPPAITGCLSFADGHRNFNVYWKDEQGRPVSLSAIALYELTDDEYRETNLYYGMNGPGTGMQYDLKRAGGVAAVERTGDRIEFQFPLHDEPYAVFEGDSFTASREGVFIDQWRRLD